MAVFECLVTIVGRPASGHERRQARKIESHSEVAKAYLEKLQAELNANQGKMKS
jgi:hypothetical protein